MHTKFGSFAGLVLATLMAATAARAQTSIEDRCLANWKDNATYRTCVANLTAKESAAIPATGICSATTCIYKLACDQAENRTCRGAGYSLVYSDSTDSPGSEITITDPKGRKSIFGETASVGIENVSGPLVKSKLRHAGHDMVLEVPK
jgi:hypothetical protein